MDKWIQKQIEEIGGIDPTYKVDTCTHCKYRTYGGHGYDICLVHSQYIESYIGDCQHLIKTKGEEVNGN